MQQAQLQTNRALRRELDNRAERRATKPLLVFGEPVQVGNAEREELDGGERVEGGGVDRLEAAEQGGRGGVGGVVEDLEGDEGVLDEIAVGFEGSHGIHFASVLGEAALEVGHSLRLLFLVDFLAVKSESKTNEDFDANAVVLAAKWRRIGSKIGERAKAVLELLKKRNRVRFEVVYGKRLVVDKQLRKG